MAELKLTNNDLNAQALYPTVFKKLNTTDVNMSAFQSYKNWTIYSGSATSSAIPLNAVYTNNVLPAFGTELTYNDASNIDGSLQSVIYWSINHLFYKYKSEPFKTYGPTDLTRITKILFQSASILSIPQIKIGEGIKPASFTFTSSVSGSYESDRYGNIIDSSIPTSSIVSKVKFYEGFNEYFDTTRIPYNTWSGLTFIPGITTTTGQQKSIGLAAKFNGAGYIETELDGLYNRNNNYAISFFISGSNISGSNQIVLTKASSSITPTYPFKIELSGSNQMVFSAAGTTTFKTQITSSTTVNTWTHIMCQKSGSWLQMYVNGTLHSQVTSNILYDPISPLTASARIDNNFPLKIGGYDTTSSNLIGVLDEVRIFNKSLTTAEISALNNRNEGGTVLQTRVVGNVFSKQGLAVFSSADYRINNLLQTPYTASYRSTLTINELSVLARLDAGDFNMSTNVSLTQDNDITYYPFVSGSDFAPYMTTIGLYDDMGRLLAVGKLAQPIRKRSDVDMNFVIRMDLDNKILLKGNK